MNKVRLMKSQGVVQSSSLIIGLAFLLNSSAFAETHSHGSSSQFLQCQTSLKRFSLHLEKRKTQSNQPYYEDLYKQTQYFLNNLVNIPDSPSQLARCENLLKVLQDIVGNPPPTSDLGPMPNNANATSGKLTPSALEAWRRPISNKMHVKYVCEDHARGKRAKEENEETQELDENLLTSRPTPQVSRMRKSSAPGGPKELE
jgi:hypothetical protein